MSTLHINDTNYMENFDKIKIENKERFKELKARKKEELSMLLQCEALGAEPYQEYKHDAI